MPLPEIPYLLHRIPEEILASFKNLRWNSIFNLNLGIKRRLNNSLHWIYFPEKNFCFFRIGFPHNFSPYLAPPDKSPLYVEVPYSAAKPIEENNIVLRIKEDLKKASIHTQVDQICLEDINDIKFGYPIYTKNNIISCGRRDSWRYMSMEDVILDGKQMSDRLVVKQ